MVWGNMRRNKKERIREISHKELERDLEELQRESRKLPEVTLEELVDRVERLESFMIRAARRIESTHDLCCQIAETEAAAAKSVESIIRFGLGTFLFALRDEAKTESDKERCSNTHPVNGARCVRPVGHTDFCVSQDGSYWYIKPKH